jgi:very-short-patch-repair endonuclease
MGRKLSQIEYLEKVKNIHGEKYDYSKLIYLDSTSKVTLVCKKHGEFCLDARDVVRKKNPRGCPKCGLIRKGLKKRISTNEFIKRSKIIHGDNYDYSKTEYVTSDKKVTITCKEHGDFEQSPFSHLDGIGCGVCSGRTIYNSNQAKQKIREVHGNKIDLSKFVYINKDYKSTLICPIHGEWKTSYGILVNAKSGCPKCGLITIGEKLKITKDEWLERCKIIHGDFYDYSNTNYIGFTEKVNIICLKHGEFLQSAYEHQRGKGCPTCSLSKGEKYILNFLEEKKIPYETQKKFIGLKKIISLRFDFYLPNQNCVIEFNGIQHYEPIEFFGGEKSFEKTQEYDTYKKEYCRSNNIGYHVIKYDEDFKKRINEILLDETTKVK